MKVCLNLYLNLDYLKDLQFKTIHKMEFLLRYLQLLKPILKIQTKPVNAMPTVKTHLNPYLGFMNLKQYQVLQINTMSTMISLCLLLLHCLHQHHYLHGLLQHILKIQMPAVKFYLNLFKQGINTMNKMVQFYLPLLLKL